MENVFDVIVVGCGPAGMTAAIYAKRAGMNVLVLEKMMPGGQIAITPLVENYSGFEKIDGMSLGQKMFQQIKSLGIEVEFCEVFNIDLEEKLKKVKTAQKTYLAPAIILAMGAASRTLGTEEDKKFVGKGLSYCTVCDGAFFKDKKVAIVGGGNTALEDIEYIYNIAKQVVHINRRSEFRADSKNVEAYEKLLKQKNSKIVPKYGFVVKKLYGKNKLEKIDIVNLNTNEVENITVDGLFVAIGRVPQTEILNKELDLDQGGYVLVDEQMQTSMEGVFACGDIIHKSLRQIATAVGDGAIAGTYASIYAKKMRAENK